jgi:ribosomal protein S18 acetylase RimI-like enzyme
MSLVGFVYVGRQEVLVRLQPTGITFMAVNPDYQRQGIGSRMMERMCEEIDRHGRHAYVLASPEGVRLYSKYCFVVVGKVETDKGIISSMLRQPRQPLSSHKQLSGE